MKPVGQIVPLAVAMLLREAPLSPGKVEFAWRAAVGPATARVTAVRLEAGTLLVDAKTPAWQGEVARSSGAILQRLHALLGDSVVQRIVVRR